MRRSLLALALAASVAPLACAGQDPLAPPVLDPDAELRVLFVGNSLTAFNDLPGLTRTVAEATGHTMAAAALLRGNTSLEDHWAAGAAQVVRDLRPDVVVLQQGPSSLPRNQDHLAFWAGRYAEVADEVGAGVALLMVWPESTRPEAFDAVLESYHRAALETGGHFVPAGEAWREIWAIDPDVELYGPDGFHPSPLGSVAAAVTLVAVLLGEDPVALPARLEPTSPGLPRIDLPEDLAATIYGGVAAAVERYRPEP